MQATESSTPAANARYASSVMKDAADIIDKAVKRGQQWSVYDALRQATGEYGARETQSNETDRSYGMVALLKDLNSIQSGMYIFVWCNQAGSTRAAHLPVQQITEGRPHPNPLPEGEGTAHSTVVLV